MNITCPFCQRENAYLEIVDEDGSHYVCPDCDSEWVDENYKLENLDNEDFE